MISLGNILAATGTIYVKLQRNKVTGILFYNYDVGEVNLIWSSQKWLLGNMHCFILTEWCRSRLEYVE